MRTVTMYETFNGVRHDSKEKAIKHLDEVYGEVITRVARELVGANGKYAAMVEILNENIELFREALKAKDDMQLQGEEGEE